MLKLSREDIRGGLNAVVNMYAFFAIIELGLSYVKQEPYSIDRVLLYAFLSHCVALFLSFFIKKDQK